MTAVLVHVTVLCPCCDGAGELSFEPSGWWHGSGVFVESQECRVCQGYGHASVEAAADWRNRDDEQEF